MVSSAMDIVNWYKDVFISIENRYRICLILKVLDKCCKNMATSETSLG